MNAYFFKMTNQERNNILDQHKGVYDGYVTLYGQNNQQPLYVQDYANDKNGITVNNRGDVGEYRNMNINEMRYDGKDPGLFSSEANEDVYSGSHGFEPEVNIDEKLDMIGDGPLDLKNGTVDFDNLDDDPNFEIDLDDLVDLDDKETQIDEDLVEPLQEQVQRTLDMFKRFKKY